MTNFSIYYDHGALTFRTDSTEFARPCAVIRAPEGSRWAGSELILPENRSVSALEALVRATARDRTFGLYLESITIGPDSFPEPSSW